MFSRLVLAIALTSAMISCTETKSTADEYLKKKSSGDADSKVADGEPDDGTDDPGETTDPGENTDPGDGETMQGEPTSGVPTMDTGDVANGNKLLETCAGCHNSGGAAKGVTLDKTAVSRLETALNGEQKATHQLFKTSFEGQNRKDLEAALKAK